MRLINKIIAFIGLILMASIAWADAPAASATNPVAMLQTTINTLQTQVASENASLAQSPDKLFALIKSEVLPVIDVEKMAGMTLGPKWRSATPAERQQFIDAFGLMLTRVYASSLSQMASYKITLYPLRGNGWQNAQQIVVRGQITGGTSDQPSNVSYYLERSGNTWKIYDFAVEGVSVMKNFQSQFQSFDDMQTVLAKLDELNKQPLQ
jgi:phospholipid transport system substrate-binding protein